jgi:hypothetical protein
MMRGSKHMAMFFSRALGSFLLGILLIGTPKAVPLDEVTTALGQEDVGAAYQILRTFAERGEPEAQFSLGRLYAKGRGTPKNEAEAVRWYLKAAEQGERNASYSLGIMYGMGRGVRQDLIASADWFMRAAQQGHAEAQYAVAVRYATGKGFLRNEVIAARWMYRAAEQGLAVAQLALARMAASSRGIPRNNLGAYTWGTVAEARLTDEKLRAEASNLRRAVSSSLTPNEIGQAQDAATKWKPSFERPVQSVEAVTREKDGIQASLNIERGEAVVSWRFIHPQTTPLSEVSGTIKGQTLGIPRLELYPQQGAKTSVLFLLDTSDRSSKAQLQQDTLTIANIAGHAQAHHQIDVATFADGLELLVSDKADIGSLLGLVQSVPPQGHAGSLSQILLTAIEVSSSARAERRGIFVLTDGHSDDVLNAAVLIERAKQAGVSLNFILRPSEAAAGLFGLKSLGQATGGEFVKGDRLADFMKSPFALLDSGATVRFPLNGALGNSGDPVPEIKVVLQHGNDYLEIVSKAPDSIRRERAALEDLFRSCYAGSCTSDFKTKIQGRLESILEDELTFKSAQNDLVRLRSYISECHACVFRDEAETLASSIEMQRLYEKLEAAGQNKEALERFLSECGTLCPKNVRMEARSRLDVASLKQQEREQTEAHAYESARGDLANLRAYVSNCSICSHIDEAREGIAWIEQQRERTEAAKKARAKKGLNAGRVSYCFKRSWPCFGHCTVEELARGAPGYKACMRS